MPRPSFTIPKKTAARELRLSEQFTPERNGDDDRSRDRTPGSEVQPQPEPQHQSQQWPRAMHLGAPPDDPHQRFQVPQQSPQQQHQQKHQKQQQKKKKKEEKNTNMTLPTNIEDEI